jgi:WD40 repeat protein
MLEKVDMRVSFENTIIDFPSPECLSYSPPCFSPKGSDDLSAKLWDVNTGQCVYGIQTHTCATVKFDEQKLVTGSFDNTVACWEWSSGARTQHFRGHTGAGGSSFFKIFYDYYSLVL